MTLLALLLAQAAFDAPTLFEQGVGRNVRLNGGALELERGELFEDDGPAAGFSYLPNEEALGPGVWIRKDLVLPDPRAARATLLVAPGGALEAVVNGKPQKLGAARKVSRTWEAYEIDPALLKPGTNEIVLHGRGKVWIARAEEFAAGSRERARHPNRSARSADGGKTWDFERLGPDGKIDGEYYVRLVLDQHRQRGSLVLPVLDLGNLEGKPLAGPVESIGPVNVRLRKEGDVALKARWGPTYAPGAAWSSWVEVGTSFEPAARFVEFAIELSTPDPRATPRVKGLELECAPRRLPDWTPRVRVVEAKNGRVVRTSIPFEYEPFDHPRLKAFRKEHRLDEVVKGARGEFELVTRLAAWAAGRWERGHLKDAYPAWDALEILKPHRDGAPVGGFCQQYNLVLLQACESFGLAGRAVSIGPGETAIRGGHEVVEIWSNEFRKWVYVDGNTAWYAVDRETEVPLSLRELRERQLRCLRKEPYRPIRVVKLAETRHEWPGLEAWPPFAELRLIPRSNFLAEKSPLPLNQGMRGWFWTGHFAWDDAEAPASLLYGHRVSRPADFDWTLNETRILLEATSQPAELRVHLDTVTPGLEAFAARFDGGAEKAVSNPFAWPLRAGPNRLEVRARNKAGRDGPASLLHLEY